MLDSSKAFSLSCSGRVSETTMNYYADFVNASLEKFQGLGGWIGDRAKKTLDGFNNFLSSRAWEMSSRLAGENNYVGRFDIGVLTSLEAQYGAVGFMRDYIMANPAVMQGYIDGTLYGYGGDINPLNTGVGEDNPYYRKATNGMLMYTENVVDEEVQRQFYHKHYMDSISSDPLSYRNRYDIQRTWNASNRMLAEGLFDFTNNNGNGELIEPAGDVTE